MNAVSAQYRQIRRWRWLLAGALLLLVLRVYVLAPYWVEQNSMQPTYKPGEYLMVDRLSPALLVLQPGEIVVVNGPSADRHQIVKRIVAVGPADVELRDGLVWVDGRSLNETYLPAGTTTEARATEHWRLGAGEYFLLGDNRGSSLDSRSFGPLPANAMVGRVLFAIPPLSDR